MKLKNKKTGEIVEKFPDRFVVILNSGEQIRQYGSLAELNEEWEDAPEEPKCGYIIDPMDEDGYSRDDDCFEEGDRQRAKELGIWFETKEEAEKAVEKLKAWKRLKDKGFRFQGWEDLEAIELPIKHYNNIVGFRLEDNHDVVVDLNTIFGGGE